MYAAPCFNQEEIYSDVLGDCKPRVPAERFKVKKEGPNQGRWCKLVQEVLMVQSLIVPNSLHLPTARARQMRLFPLGGRCENS
jgi:hypothetical protein